MSDTVRPPSLTSEADPRPPSARSSIGSNASLLDPSRASIADLPRVCPTCGVRYPVEFRVCPRDATELDDAMSEEEPDELIGQIVGQTYNLVRVIGEGGMGRVYEARHQRIRSKRFAVKVLHPEFSRKTEVLSRFQREAEAAATIQSPHVVQVYDVHKTPEGRPYMVGEFLEGVELADHLNAMGRLPLADAIRITRQICTAMASAHAHGIVHRDLKPENVFLTGPLEAPIAKVIDFGISKTGDQPGTQLTKTGMIMGTPSFMAPEQAKGEKATHLVDVYAVGAILYTMLTGSRPFDRNDPMATLTAVLVEDPPRPCSLEPSIPESVEAVIQTAMAKEPSDRYPSIQELDRALAPYDESPNAGRSISTGNTLSGLPSAAIHASPAASATARTRPQDASLARPTILLSSIVGGLTVLSALMSLVSAAVRITRGSDLKANLSGAEAAVLVAILLVAAAAPSVMWATYLKKTVWNNTAKAVDLAQRLKWPTLVSLAAYGFGSLLVRVVEGVLLQRAVGMAWPTWDVVMLVFAGAAVIGLYAAPKLDRG